MKNILFLILVNSVLLAQESDKVLKYEQGFSINKIDSYSDTLLSYEIFYDSLTRRQKIVNYPLHDKNGIIQLREYSYMGDTIIELFRTINHDTLKRTITLKKDNSLRLQLEDRTFGWWMSGKYSKNKFHSVRQYIYNNKNELKELLLYSEGRDTAYHLFYSYKKDSITNLTVQSSHDIKSNTRSTHIIQAGTDSKLDESCDSNCTKRIFMQLDTSGIFYGTSNANIYIENGDTTCRSSTIELQLPNNYTSITRTNIYYNDQHSHRSINYYNSKRLYRKETYGWNNESWILNQEEIYIYNDQNNEKSTARTTYRNGEKNHVYHTLIKYDYY